MPKIGIQKIGVFNSLSVSEKARKKRAFLPKNPP